MKTQTGLFFAKTFILLSFVLGLSGCVGPAILAAQYAPGVLGIGSEPQVEFGDSSSRIADQSALADLKSVATLDRNVYEWFTADGRFSSVKQLSNQPKPSGPISAAKIAADSGADAFILIEPFAPRLKINPFNQKISRGAVAMTIYNKDGSIVYKQTASLMQSTSSNQPVPPTEVVRMLLQAFLKDMRQTTLTEEKT